MVDLLWRSIVLTLCLGAVAMAAEQPLRDPLQPSGYRTVAQPVATKASVNTADWALGAVLLSEQRRVAIIDGQPLQLGDRYKGYRLDSVEADRVVLTNGTGRVVLRRAGSGLKKVAQ